jgi:cytochrome oxidase Cu insertion factor (SCO1/SenC/PrrC family)
VECNRVHHAELVDPRIDDGLLSRVSDATSIPPAGLLIVATLAAAQWVATQCRLAIHRGPRFRVAQPSCRSSLLMSSSVRIWLTVLLVVVGVYGTFAGYRAWSQSHHTAEVVEAVVAPTRSPSEFHFTGADGLEVRLAEMEGKVWVASFFFSSCPGACRLMNQALVGVQKELTNQGVTIVSISVDPEIDTPETLTKYAEVLNADREHWLFLTGPLKEAQELGEGAFGVSVHGKDHSDRLILVDAKGKVQGRYRALEPQQIRRMKEKVAELTASSTTQPST